MKFSTGSLLHACFALALGVATSGCETIKVLQVPEVEGAPGGDVVVSLLGRRPAPGLSDAQKHAAFDEISKLPPAVREICFRTKDTNGIRTFDVGATSIPLIMAGVTLAYNSVTEKFKEAAKAKISRYQKPYHGQINVPALITVGAGNAAMLQCVQLVRTIQVKDALPHPASHIVLAFESVGTSAFAVKPVYVRLDKFAASTIPEETGNQVDLAISLGIITLASDGGDPGLHRYEQNIAMTGVLQGKEHDISRVPPTAIIPRVDDRPATIVVSVTETGKGFEMFEGFEKAFDTNSQIIGTALGKAIETRLTAISNNKP